MTEDEQTERYPAMVEWKQNIPETCQTINMSVLIFSEVLVAGAVPTEPITFLSESEKSHKDFSKIWSQRQCHCK